ncbi:MAG: hypothetical protein HOV76_11685 [Hamadaea sp.]|nr:hypothetical protein [Hamadaea sp.]
MLEFDAVIVAPEFVTTDAPELAFSVTLLVTESLGAMENFSPQPPLQLTPDGRFDSEIDTSVTGRIVLLDTLIDTDLVPFWATETMASSTFKSFGAAAEA